MSPASQDSPSPKPTPAAAAQRPGPRLRDTALASGIVKPEQIDACQPEAAASLEPAYRDDPSRVDKALARCLVSRKILTQFQAEQLLAGRRKLTLGQYEIQDEIGHGGMGQVFQARHALMERTVAVKVLPRSKSTADTEAAFTREIRMLSRLDHENLVRALDAGRDGNVYYLVTELVPGMDLRKQVLKHGPLKEGMAASIIAQAARGLAYAHDQGLIHRDVKPANLLVGPDGRTKVLDLGLAGSVLEADSTRLGRVVGTVDFMAPEQIRSPDEVGTAADIYALGCTLYFAVTGRVPFPGGTRQEKAERQKKEQPRPIRELEPEINADFCSVVEQMMQKNPKDRPRTAAAVVTLLQAWIPDALQDMPRTKLKRPTASPDQDANAAASLSERPIELSGSSQGQASADLSAGVSQLTKGLFLDTAETHRESGRQTVRRKRGAAQSPALPDPATPGPAGVFSVVEQSSSAGQQPAESVVSYFLRRAKLALRSLFMAAIAAIVVGGW